MPEGRCYSSSMVGAGYTVEEYISSLEAASLCERVAQRSSPRGAAESIISSITEEAEADTFAAAC